MCVTIGRQGLHNSSRGMVCVLGTGFLTAYSYNLAAGQTTVAQGAQTRTFQMMAAMILT